MKFEDLFSKKGREIGEVVRKNKGTALILSIPLWVYCFISIDRSTLNLVFLTIIFLLLIGFLHFYSDFYVEESKWKILNYAPIWSITSAILVILVFLSEIINFGQMITRVICVIGITILLFWAMGISDIIVEDEE